MVYLTLGQMKELTTKRLLAYKKSIRKHIHESYYCPSDCELLRDMCMVNMKYLLDEREHISKAK